MPGTNYPQDDGPEGPTAAAVSRPRVGSRLWDKLDHIEQLVSQRVSGAASSGDDSTTPTVTFEPDPADLPIVAGDEPEPEPEDLSPTGEGSANLAFEKPARYRFPHRRRVEVGA